MHSIKAMMQAREDEIRQYAKMLDFFEKEIQNGLPKIVGMQEEFQLETTHLHIFKANQYLLLYNYIEAIITQSLKKLAEYIMQENKPITAFIEPIQKEWLANGLELHDYKTTPETRLKKGLALLGSFNNTSVIQISKGGGGNFNNEEIEKLASKLSFSINFRPGVQSNLRKAGRKTYVTHGKNKDTCIKEITRERNKLAHGEITFADCGQSCEFDTLRDIMNTTFLFMQDFVNSLDNYIQNKQYLKSP